MSFKINKWSARLSKPKSATSGEAIAIKLLCVIFMFGFVFWFYELNDMGPAVLFGFVALIFSIAIVLEIITNIRIYLDNRRGSKEGDD